MMESKQEKQRKRLLLGLSLCFHALLLIGAYHLPIKKKQVSQGLAYAIVLNTTASYQNSANTTKCPETQSAAPPNKVPTPTKQIAKTKPMQKVRPIKAQQNKKPVQEEATTAERIQQQVESIGMDPPDAVTTDKQSSTSETPIDERGLYTTLKDGKKTGALLELVGWVWDTAPQPQDMTDESGKIVFEITIDDLGEVVAVKTLEKTVSPLVEKIYKEAVIKLTFSKHADNTLYTPIATGKVTFLIKAR